MKIHRGTFRSFFIVVALSVAGQAHAWNVEVGIDRLEDYFYVDSFSGGTPPSMVTLQEGIFASSDTGSFDSTYTFQTWNGSAWSSTGTFEDVIFVDGVSAESHMEHYDDPGINDEYPDSSYAFVFGDIAPGQAYGASWAFDFELTVAPFSFASVLLDSDGAYGFIVTEPGDDGNAFASIRLYDPTVGLNDPGGANDPFAIDSIFATSPPIGQDIDEQLGFTHTFTNNTGSAVTYSLRLAGRASVFETVPEPATAGLLLALGLPMLIRRTRSRNR